jgi:hypothetical protein
MYLYVDNVKERDIRLRDNPHLASWIFGMRANSFIQHMCSAWNVDWYWYRFETQHRGSWHVHGCFKIKSDRLNADFITNSSTALHGFLAKRKLNDMRQEETPTPKQKRVRSIVYFATFITYCSYFDFC